MESPGFGNRSNSGRSVGVEAGSGFDGLEGAICVHCRTLECERVLWLMHELLSTFRPSLFLSRAACGVSKRKSIEVAGIAASSN